MNFKETVSVQSCDSHFNFFLGFRESAFLGLIISVLALILGCAAFFFLKPNNFRTNIPSRAFTSQNFILSAKNALAPLQRILVQEIFRLYAFLILDRDHFTSGTLFRRTWIAPGISVCQDIPRHGALRLFGSSSNFGLHSTISRV